MALDPISRHRQRRADYVAVFTSDAGGRVLSDLYRFCHMGQPTFAADPFITAFNEGQRRVFLRVVGMLRLTDRDILTLSTESQDE